MSENAGLNHRLFSAHERSLQSMLNMIVYAARIELHNAVAAVAIEFMRRTAPQMHNAAGNAVLLNEVCNVLHKFARSVIFQWRVLQKQIVRVIGIGSVHKFMFIGMQ